MLIAKHCTVCQSEIDEAEIVLCGECENTIHESCAEYERQFRCQECASEPGIGAVEL